MKNFKILPNLPETFSAPLQNLPKNPQQKKTPAKVWTAEGHVAENNKFWRRCLASIKPMISSEWRLIP